MSKPEVMIAGAVVSDSVFSVGRSMYVSKPYSKSIELSGEALGLLRELSLGEALTLSSLAQKSGRSRAKTDKMLKRLQNAGMVKYASVATDYSVFKLWLPSDVTPPRTAGEACRLAVLGIFFTLAAQEAPGFRWRLIRQKSSPVLGELVFAGSKGQEKWIIDAPRRGENMAEEADLYIFPTIEEARAVIPRGKKYTSELLLLWRESSLREMIREH